MPITLRDYQTSGVTALRNSFRSGKSAPLYVCPTGGGKTIIFCHIAEGVQQRQKRAVILVHRQELLTQTSRALRDLGVDHALIAPSWRYRGEPIAVASVQTLASRLKRATARELLELYNFDLIITDEAHHSPAGQWKYIHGQFPHAKILGVPATPCRTDGKGLGVDAGGCFDDLILGPTIQWLISEGYLTKPVTYAPPTKIDLSEVHTRGGDWNNKELAAVLDKPKITGDAVAHYARLCPFKPAIVFCASIEHAQHVAADFRAAGFVAMSLDGKMGDAERRAGIQGLASGDIHVLTSCDLISEGTDIPVVTAAILLRPTQSEGLYLQQVGRALRPVYADGYDLKTREGRLAAIANGPKPVALILDHVGNCLVHGLAQEEREWSLEGAPRKKRGKQERVIPLKQCPNCYAWVDPAPKCSECGHVFDTESRDIQQVEGELKPLTDEEIEALRKQRKREQGSAQTIEQLIELGKARGYKNPTFWAKHVLRARESAR